VPPLALERPQQSNQQEAIDDAEFGTDQKYLHFGFSHGICAIAREHVQAIMKLQTARPLEEWLEAGVVEMLDPGMAQAAFWQ
jgi:hypothetical protein